MHNYFVRITRSYSDLSGLVLSWSARADKMVVYEHCGDETEKIHIHMVIINSDIHKKQLKNIAPASLQLKGNEDWSFKEYDNDETAMTYMTKGTIDPSFNKGFTQEQIDKWKSSFVVRPAKLNRYQLLYNKACNTDYLREKHKIWKERYTVENTPEFFVFLLWHCRQEAFKFNREIWSPVAITDYKTLVFTHLYRGNIRVPLDKQYDKWRSLV